MPPMRVPPSTPDMDSHPPVRGFHSTHSSGSHFGAQGRGRPLPRGIGRGGRGMSSSTGGRPLPRPSSPDGNPNPNQAQVSRNPSSPRRGGLENASSGFQVGLNQSGPGHRSQPPVSPRRQGQGQTQGQGQPPPVSPRRQGQGQTQGQGPQVPPRAHVPAHETAERSSVPTGNRGRSGVGTALHGRPESAYVVPTPVPRLFDQPTSSSAPPSGRVSDKEYLHLQFDDPNNPNNPNNPNPNHSKTLNLTNHGPSANAGPNSGYRGSGSLIPMDAHKVHAHKISEKRGLGLSLKKSLSITSTKFVNRGKRSSVMSVETMYGGNARIVKQFTTQLEDTIKAMRKLNSAYDGYHQALRQSWECIRSVGALCNRIDEEANAQASTQQAIVLGPRVFGPFVDSAAEFECMRGSSTRDLYCSGFIEGIVEWSESVCKEELPAARRAKDQFQKAQIQYTAAEKELQQATKSKRHMELFYAYNQFYYAKRKLRVRRWKAECTMRLAVNKKMCGFMQKWCESMEGVVREHRMVCERWQDFETQQVDLALQNAQERANQYDRHYQALSRAVDEEEKQREANKYDLLVELLAAEGLGLLNAVCVSAGSAQEATLESLVRILDAHKQTIPIIGRIITMEVDQTSAATTLFRGNSAATKLMSSFTRMTGKTYLTNTLGALIAKVVSDPSGYEVDPNRVPDGQDIDANRKRLIALVQDFLEAILSSMDVCPLPFFAISWFLYHQVERRFTGKGNIAVGGFYFLRFFCPAILSPDSNGLVQGEVPKDVRRVLILVSKTLQNISNGVLFGKKEAYMEEMNTFITANLERVEDLFRKLVSLDPATLSYEPLASLAQVTARELPHIHATLVRSLEKVCKCLTQYKDGEVIPVLACVLGRAGPVPDVGKEALGPLSPRDKKGKKKK